MIKEILNLLFHDLNKNSNNNELAECFDKWKNYREQLISQKIDLEKQIDKTVFFLFHQVRLSIRLICHR